MEKMGRIIIVCGMQFGSEGKGAIVSYLAPSISMGVRTGAVNAGHTFYYRKKKFIMRQIPCVWMNPLSKLVIGRGAIISLDVLLQEIELLSNFVEIKNRLFIDGKAHVITEDQVVQELKSDLAKRIGSTSAISGEGIGTTTADKVLRKDSCLQARECSLLKPFICDTVDLVNTELDEENLVLLEGTQGFGLSLEHGFYPFVTSRDVSVSALAASAGVSLHEFWVDVIGVVRTYPIRVAGNSGPFGEDSREITWGELSQRAGSSKIICERTSVTKKIRRVATFSQKEFLRACQVNRPTEIALTFADYIDWSIHEKEKISLPVEEFIKELEDLSGKDVTLIKTGPKTIIDCDWYRRSMIRKMKCYDD